MVVFPEPVYNGPENVTYFQGAELYVSILNAVSHIHINVEKKSWLDDYAIYEYE